MTREARDAVAPPCLLACRRRGPEPEREAAFDLVFLDLPRRVAKVLLSQPRGGDGVIRLRMNRGELAHQVGGSR
jgi:hypothetical protein